VKEEYNLSVMKRNGHPLRKKVSQGEFKLISPIDIPDREAKLEKLTPEERNFVTQFLESNYTKK
jgi:hypothetical protein